MIKMPISENRFFLLNMLFIQFDFSVKDAYTGTMTILETNTNQEQATINRTDFLFMLIKPYLNLDKNEFPRGRASGVSRGMTP